MGWNMNNIINDLIKLQDKNYRDFQVKLFPTLSADTIIGVRTPVLRSYAKKMVKEKVSVSLIIGRLYGKIAADASGVYFDSFGFAFLLRENGGCGEFSEFQVCLDAEKRCASRDKVSFERH